MPAPAGRLRRAPEHAPQHAHTQIGAKNSPAEPRPAPRQPRHDKSGQPACPKDDSRHSHEYVAPSGTSYCLVKVFDADDRSLVGEYRYERESDGTKVQWSKRCTNVVDTSEKPGNWRAVID